ncbi:MAG: prepilin-type N-terminal cleavage/methylation domain-containing protein [Candidatus Gracilibacteria bacterium]|nr:prepilin-type N-terminal cleavage/methylation domain-containing protein [Candidatus Gracilibacteria bacterium]
MNKISSLRGFSLIEVLVATVMISIVLIGSIGMTTRYIYNYSWPKLFDAVEQEFLDVNTAALAGFSKAFAKSGENIAEIPEMYHLYFEEGDDLGMYYLETRMQDVLSNEVEKRQITYQEYVSVDVDMLKLERIALFATADPSASTVLSREGVLMTWSNPFSQLSFRFLPINKKMDRVSVNVLVDTFDLPDEPSDCEQSETLKTPGNCFVGLKYSRPGTTQEKSVMFGKQKGIYRDFY